MIHAGQPAGECLELPRELRPIDRWRGNITFKPGQNLAVEAAAILCRALLEKGVDFLGNVLERQRERGFSWNRNGTVPD